jgi:hypothetical protein
MEWAVPEVLASGAIGSIEYHYELQHREHFSSHAWQTVYGVGNQTTQHEITGLTSAVEYEFQLRARAYVASEGWANSTWSASGFAAPAAVYGKRPRNYLLVEPQEGDHQGVQHPDDPNVNAEVASAGAHKGRDVSGNWIIGGGSGPSAGHPLGRGKLGFENQAHGSAGATPQKGVAVRMVVTTSRKKYAATSDKIYITFHGMSYISPEVVLSHGFGRGSREVLDIPLPDQIGRLHAIELRNDGNDAWRFTSITAQIEDRRYFFPQRNHWLVNTDIAVNANPQRPQHALYNQDPNTPGFETMLLEVQQTQTVAVDAMIQQTRSR